MAALCCLSHAAAAVTFFVSPDTHFTQCGGVPDIGKNARGISEMNALPGVMYPNTSHWGGAVEEPHGVVLPGDLIDDGCADSSCAAQLSNYTSRFPLTGGNGSGAVLRFAVFEGVGNHDGGNSTDPATGLLRRTVIARNRHRAVLAPPAAYRLSANGLHYSWEWEGVHFVMLGVYPGTAGDCASGVSAPGVGCDAKDPPWGWHSPEHSLEFLVDDLAAVGAQTPIVLVGPRQLKPADWVSWPMHVDSNVTVPESIAWQFTHYGLRGFGAPGSAPWPSYSPDFWWSAREAHAFAQAIRGHNVVALIHGHTHTCSFYSWDLTNVTGRTVDVYNAPALQKGGSQDPPTTLSQFLVFEVDLARSRLRAFQRVGSAWGAIMHEKSWANASAPLAAPHGAASSGSTPMEAAAVGAIRVRAEDPPVSPWWVQV